MSESGSLSLVATPIGNLEDMSMRAIRTLKEADLIAAEDTRNSIKLLNHFDIKTEMTSYHEFNKIDKGQELVRAMQNGKNVALITDAGTPGISDPGEELVRMCITHGIQVTTIPGPAAFVNAAIISGFPCRRLAFEAFLPKDKKEHDRVLKEMEQETRTIIMYEAPHHLKKTLKELFERLGDRNIALVRELTKLHEEVLRFKISEAMNYYEEHEPRGEYAIVIEGRSKEEIEQEQRAKWEEMSLEEHMDFYMNQGITKKDAMKKVAKDRGIQKRDVYNALIK